MSTGGGISGGAANWSSGFLPTVYTGVRFRNQGDPILERHQPRRASTPQLQRDSLDLIGDLNRQRLGDDRRSGDRHAHRLLRDGLPAANLGPGADGPDAARRKETLDLYGADPDKPSFARACLLARRMIERGVRFVNIYHEGWDAHSDVAGNLQDNCGETDQASAALVQDLKQRGLLDDTLVIWGGEFGRTPMVETQPGAGPQPGPRPSSAGVHDVAGRRRHQAGPDLRRDRRAGLPRRREPGPRPRPAGDDPAPARASTTSG